MSNPVKMFLQQFFNDQWSNLRKESQSYSKELWSKPKSMILKIIEIIVKWMYIECVILDNKVNLVKLIRFDLVSTFLNTFIVLKLRWFILSIEIRTITYPFVELHQITAAMAQLVDLDACIRVRFLVAKDLTRYITW